jgi:hypothetical protein
MSRRSGVGAAAVAAALTVSGVGVAYAAAPSPDLTYEVAPTGNDANPCTAAQPCLTVQQAINLGTAPANATKNVLIQVAAGAYDPTGIIPVAAVQPIAPAIAPASLTISGDGTGPTGTVFHTGTAAVAVLDSATFPVYLQNLSITQGSGIPSGVTDTHGVWGNNTGAISLTNVAIHDLTAVNHTDAQGAAANGALSLDHTTITTLIGGPEHGSAIGVVGGAAVTMADSTITALTGGANGGLVEGVIAPAVHLTRSAITTLIGGSSTTTLPGPAFGLVTGATDLSTIEDSTITGISGGTGNGKVCGQAWGMQATGPATVTNSLIGQIEGSVGGVSSAGFPCAAGIAHFADLEVASSVISGVTVDAAGPGNLGGDAAGIFGLASSESLDATVSVTNSVVRTVAAGAGADGKTGGTAVGLATPAIDVTIARSEISDIKGATGVAGGAGGGAGGISISSPDPTTQRSISESTVADVVGGDGGSGSAVGSGGEALGIISGATTKPLDLTHVTVANTKGGSAGGTGARATAVGLGNGPRATMHPVAVLLNNPDGADCSSPDGFVDPEFNLTQDTSCSFTGPGNQVVASLGSGLQALDGHGGSLPAAALGGPSHTVGVDITTPQGRTVALAVTDPQFCSGDFNTDQRGEPVPGTGTSACAAGAFEPNGNLGASTGNGTGPGGTSGNGGGRSGSGRGSSSVTCGALTTRPTC